MKLGKPVENEIWLSIMNKIKFHIGGLVFCSVSNSVWDSINDSVRDSVDIVIINTKHENR